MFDCIYTPYCTYKQCDLACPIHAEITYWMERCKIDIKDPILRTDRQQIEKCSEIIDKHIGELCVYKARDTVAAADLFCYCAICKYGRGTALSNGIYNLNFMDYIEEIKKSWQTRYESEELQFMKIWTDSSSILVVSHLDYVSFADFESQTMLALMQMRKRQGKTTFIIQPQENSLIGKGNGFFPILTEEMKGVEIK